MKRSRQWSFYLVSSGSSRIKQIKISKIIIILVSVLTIFSACGFARCVYFVTSYGYARFGFYNERMENKALLKKVAFLKRLAEDYNNKIKNFIAFEDNARLKFGMNPISEDIRLAGIGGRPSPEQIISASLEDPIVRKASVLQEKIDALFRQITFQDTTFSRMADHVLVQRDRWAQRPSVWPTRGRVTSSFGYRSHPFMRGMIFHEGLDIANKRWTPVFATADGIVSFLGCRGNYGTSIMIDHIGSGYTTVYAHLQQSAVVVGQVVKRRELIGYLGSSGRSTGPHLHYEVRKFNKHVNPMNYILPIDVVVD